MGIYSIQDIEEPIQIHAFDADFNILEKAINSAFMEDHPYACLDDLPYIEYNQNTGKVEIDSEYYNVDPKLQEYLNDFNHKLNTIPITKIKLKPIELYIIHPEDDCEAEIGIQRYIDTEE